MELLGAIHSTKISGNFGPKLNGSVWSNRKSFEKTGPPFEVDHFSRSDRLEFWLNGSRPLVLALVTVRITSLRDSSHSHYLAHESQNTSDGLRGLKFIRMEGKCNKTFGSKATLF